MKVLWRNEGYNTGICLEGLRKTTKDSIRMAGLWVQILTQDLPNTKQDYDVWFKRWRETVTSH
jgi:hypothetical protein